MRKFLKILAVVTGSLLMLAGCGRELQSPVTIHLVGDSTMADKPDPDRNPERGWGQLLHLYFNGQVTVRNHAVNGRSSRSFLNEGRWNRVMEKVRPGDYVFIQFGHNDQKAYDPERYTNPWSAYRRNLEKMIKETREHRAYPVILSSIVRRNFNANGTLEDTHGPYPFVARSVAREMGVPFIDLQQQTEDLVSGLGPVRSKALYMNLLPGEYEMYPEGRTDNTHLNVSGAKEVAGMVAASILRQGISLVSYLDPSVYVPRVLLVTGGHSYDTIQFFDMFRSMERFRLDTLSQPHAMGLLESDYIFNYSVLLFYDYVPDLPLKDSAIYTNLSFHGMPMLFLHHSICSFQRWEGFREIVGGRYVMEGFGNDTSALSGYTHDLDIPVTISGERHPITKGMKDFMIHDEGYRNLELTSHITPLLSTDHPDCSGTLAWENRFRDSRVVTIVLGHDRQAYDNGSFCQLLENSIGWLAEEGMNPNL